MAYEYQTLKIAASDQIMTVTIHQPPMNVMTIAMYQELVAFTEEVEQDTEIKVVVLQSADPDFFIAHFDVEALLGAPTDLPPDKRRRSPPAFPPKPLPSVRRL